MNATCFLFIKFRISIQNSYSLEQQKIAQSKNSILLDVDGMKCGSCVQAVEKLLSLFLYIFSISRQDIIISIDIGSIVPRSQNKDNFLDKAFTKMAEGIVK